MSMSAQKDINFQRIGFGKRIGLMIEDYCWLFGINLRQ